MVLKSYADAASRVHFPRYYGGGGYNLNLLARAFRAYCKKEKERKINRFLIPQWTFFLVSSAEYFVVNFKRICRLVYTVVAHSCTFPPPPFQAYNTYNTVFI